MRKVLGIHLICHNNLNVEDSGEGSFTSGHWKIAERHANTAQYLALHESKKQSSYRQGRIEKWERCLERPDRITFFIKATNEPIDWRGGGTGEKGYFWSDD